MVRSFSPLTLGEDRGEGLSADLLLFQTVFDNTRRMIKNTLPKLRTLTPGPLPKWIGGKTSKPLIILPWSLATVRTALYQTPSAAFQNAWLKHRCQDRPAA